MHGVSQSFTILVADDDADDRMFIREGFEEAGIENDSMSINELTLKNLLLKGRMEEASTLALDMIQVQTGTAINPQLLLKAAWASLRDQDGIPDKRRAGQCAEI